MEDLTDHEKKDYMLSELDKAKFHLSKALESLKNMNQFTTPEQKGVVDHVIEDVADVVDFINCRPFQHL